MTNKFAVRYKSMLFSTMLALMPLLVTIDAVAQQQNDLTSSAEGTNDGNVFSPHFSREIIFPANIDVPLLNVPLVEPTTRIKLTRLTDSSKLEGTEDAFVSYSRYSPENSSGELFLAFGTNSTSSWVINRRSGEIVSKLQSLKGKTIGENHEIRWDISGEHPNRLYYRDEMQFFMIEDVYSALDSTRLIKDFSKDFPNSSKIYNDVEGDSSNDSDHWAFMAAHYNYDIGAFVVDAYIHYQISTNTTHSLKPDDLKGSNLEGEVGKKNFSFRPNMVEISPDGSGIVMHHGRKWDNSAYSGSMIPWINTWYDGAWLWPLDFDFKSTPPKKIAIDETHSGWASNKKGASFFISQNNRNDYVDAIPLSNTTKSLKIGSHRDMGWSNGFHFGKMPTSTPNWILVSTYSPNTNTGEKLEWAANQIFMLELKEYTSRNRVLRIGPTYNKYSGNYRDEAIAAINLTGERIYFSSNWNGKLKHREIFAYELPPNWAEY